MARTAAQWEGLSPSYRHRIEKSVGREGYLRGDPLSKARGHEGGEGKAALIERAFKLKKEVYGDSSKWHEDRSRKNIVANPENGNNRTIREIRQIIRYLKARIKNPNLFDLDQLPGTMDIQAQGQFVTFDLEDGEHFNAFWYH